MSNRRKPDAFIIRAINNTTEAKLVPYSDELMDKSDRDPINCIKCYNLNLNSLISSRTYIAYCGWNKGPEDSDYRNFEIIDYVKYDETNFEVMLNEISFERAKAIDP